MNILGGVITANLGVFQLVKPLEIPIQVREYQKQPYWWQSIGGRHPRCRRSKYKQRGHHTLREAAIQF
jgi:hypothetical protein